METLGEQTTMNGILSASSHRGNGINEVVTRNSYILQAFQLLEEGQFQAALHFLNICLGDTDEADPPDLETQVDDLIKRKQFNTAGLQTQTDPSLTDEISLVEKRCLVNMRLKRYSKVIHDAKKMLDFSGENAVAYKCLLVALCKMKKVSISQVK